MTWVDLITDSLQEIGAYAPGDTISAPVMDVSTRRLNYLIDEWNALRRFAYNVGFTLYTLAPNHQPTLLGPNLTAPDWPTPNASARPPSIIGADLVLNTSNPATDLPINIRDDKWWLEQRTKAITSTVPTNLYYSPDWNIGGVGAGALYFWPIPTVAYQVRLEFGVWVGQVSDITQPFTAPQAYPKALMLTLAEDLTTVLGRAMPATLPQRALKARTALQTNNMTSPRISSADYGAGRGNSRSGFNWISGLPS